MRIYNTSTFKMMLRNGPYSWPGGYPLYFIDCDEDEYCFECVMNDRVNHIKRLRPKTASSMGMFWSLVAVEVNWEDENLRCFDCGKKIESAYGE